MTPAGNILEIFSSFQGEGLYAGQRQIFVRLAGCHMRCCYCDTPESWKFTHTARIASRGNDAPDTVVENPLTADAVMETIEQFQKTTSHHSVCITGGEPLLQTDFLAALLPAIRRTGLPIYLETSGTLADKFALVADLVDIVAFDVKLPSCPGVTVDWEDTRRCLRIALEKGRDIMAKIIVRKDDLPDAAAAIGLVAACGQAIPVIIQPVTPYNGSGDAPGWDALSNLKNHAGSLGLAAHVIPQLHKIAGWR